MHHAAPLFQALQVLRDGNSPKNKRGEQTPTGGLKKVCFVELCWILTEGMGYPWLRYARVRSEPLAKRSGCFALEGSPVGKAL